ncbi:TonB-dependent receptor [Rhizorhabdus histidinilytica]|uniref:TonB-dependent receptor n=1 Tax=Rhizorhabdus histidinilytica TaxID=439228 RepID=UPI001ADD3922|nr:TonB-dependent receptor [Rhizorhabdus histidinilytica]
MKRNHGLLSFQLATVSVRVLAIGLLASLPSVAVAQETDASPGPDTAPQADAAEQSGLQEIVVTAQKRSENINKVGISITAVGSEDLAQRGVADVSDLVKVVPGFNYTPSAYGTPVYTLRGIGFYETSLGAAPAVSIYVDEVPLPFSAMATGAALDLERVEVLKGPQGTLFGGNSTGGAINYIAAKPTPDFRAGADLTYGRFDRAEIKGYVSGPLSDTLEARLAVQYTHSGDWQRSYTREDGLGKGNVLIGRLLLKWEPSDRLTVNLNVNGWRDKTDTQAAQLVAAVSPNAAVRALLDNYPDAPASNRAADWDPGKDFERNNGYWQASARIDYELGADLDLTSITAFQKINRKSLVETDGTAIETLASAVPGTSKDFSQELRLAGETGPIRFVIGGNYAYDFIDDSLITSAATSSFPFDIAGAVSKQKVNTYAVFGNIDFKVTDTVTLQGGLRYTDQRRSFEGCSYDSGAGDLSAVISRFATLLSGIPTALPPGACITLSPTYRPGVVFNNLNEDNVSWRAGVNWQAAPRALIYANVSKGYKNGAFPTTGATASLQLAPAKQESVLAYEAGFKLTLFDQTLQLNGAGFYYDYRGKQLRGKVIDPVLGPLNALVNVPKSRIAGAELQATWQPTEGLNINMGGTYIGSKILGNFINYDALGVLGPLSGDPFPLTPKWQFVGDAQYEFPVGNDMNAFIGGAMNYQGRTNGGLGDLALFDMPGYTLYDARIGVKSPDDKWRASFTVQNLTDKYYSTLVNLPTADAVIRYTGRPRTWAFNLSYRY